VPSTNGTAACGVTTSGEAAPNSRDTDQVGLFHKTATFRKMATARTRRAPRSFRALPAGELLRILIRCS